MSGDSRKLKRKRRLHKWLAIMLAVLLLTEQSDVFVRAEEGVGDAPQTETSSGEVGTDTQNQDNTADGDHTENADSTGDGNTENPGNTGDGADDAKTGMDTDGGNNVDSDDGNTGDGTEGGGEQKPCICEIKCTADSVDADCPVCAADYSACIGKTDDAEKIDGNIEADTDGQDQCGCETACTADKVNTECPVCVADYSACTKNVGGGVNPAEEEIEIMEEIPPAQTVSGNGVDLETGSAMLAGDYTFTYNDIEYAKIETNREVRVYKVNAYTASGDIVIPEEVSDGNYTYRVTQIGYRAFARCSGLQSVTIPDSVTMISHYAFDGCSGLESMVIPDSVTDIGSRAFERCTGLRSVRLPVGLTRIEEGVFDYCRNLCEIEIPEGVTFIGLAAFGSCTSLGTASGGTITIPDSVTMIDCNAFFGCTGLTSIKIPDNVWVIYPFVFEECSNLSKVELPAGIKHICNDAFQKCSSLQDIELPEAVTTIRANAFQGCSSLESIKIPGQVTEIDEYAFSECGSLQLVELSNGITAIGKFAFEKCGSIESIQLPKTVASIERGAFRNCTGLNRLQIVVSSDGEITPIAIGKPNKEGEEVFANLPIDRTVVFLAEDGSELTGTALENARRAYIEAGKTDDNPDDGKWYGWSVGELSETVDTYKVTIPVQKDGQPWTVDCDRKFALSKDNGNTYVENLDAVEAGDYVIYDVTDGGNKLKTDISVEVTNADAVSDAVDYYTVSFYDGDVAYGAGTPQEPQIILSGRQAARPADPGKADYQFAGWKTAKGGSTPYKFDYAVTEKTDIYASWIEKTAEQLHITASAEEGGTISPAGDVPVTKGGEQTFTITPDEGNRIKSVTVDGKDVTGELADHMARARADAKYYTFTNVTENHTIHAVFENDGSNPGGGGDNPNPGGGDNPNPGGGGDNSNPGGGSGGSGDDPNPGSVDNTGSVQVTVVSETASPQAGKDSAGNTVPAQSQSVGGQENAAGGHAASETGQKANGTGQASDGTEPKTGDTSYLEVYATLAMIAGLTWLLLCFMDEARGMSEREKEVFVAAFIRWGKKGGAFRKCCAMAAIFCLLAYYHTIGKRVSKNALPENYLGQAS